MEVIFRTDNRGGFVSCLIRKDKYHTNHPFASDEKFRFHCSITYKGECSDLYSFKEDNEFCIATVYSSAANDSGYGSMAMESYPVTLDSFYGLCCYLAMRDICGMYPFPELRK